MRHLEHLVGNHRSDRPRAPGAQIFTPGAFTLIDQTSWDSTPVLRLANNLTLPSNQFGLNIQVNVPAPTGATAPYEKAAAIFFARTNDPSTSFTLDMVGLDTRGAIANSNPQGRAWGLVVGASIDAGGTGDGFLVGAEIAVTNNGTDQANLNTATSKYGVKVLGVGNPSTIGILIDRASPTGTFHHGIYMDPAALAATGTANFLTLFGKFAVDKTGSVLLTTGLTSGAPVNVTQTQSAPNAGDTSDGGLSLNYVLSAASAVNELVARVLKVTSNNSLTGGGALQNARLVNVSHTNNAGTTTTSLDGIYIDATAGGTVTTGAAIRIASWLGTTKWGIADDSGANWYNTGGVSVGTATAPGATGQIRINNAAFMLRNSTSFTNGAGAATGTLTNAPAAGNPTKWIAVDDNGTTRQIPAW